MSTLQLSVAKAFLDVMHSADDEKLQLLLDGAEQEALDFMNRASFETPAADGVGAALPMNAAMKVGVLLLLQAIYQATTDDAEKLRRAAEIKLFPHRIDMGV